MVTVEREPVERDERRGQAAILRRIWRLHFWIGLFAAPVLILLAGTGLIILYTQPLDLWLHRDLQVVTPSASTVSLDTQVDTARRHVDSTMILDAVTPPQSPDRSTQVDFLPAEEP
ncbi:MAG TPA: PepSY-associated TM helix domain-containing protein, partial [Mycobacterium sp.]|nr:PepSY-associated TM helix domain-containing protein [Mycobacterium sp.]